MLATHVPQGIACTVTAASALPGQYGSSTFTYAASTGTQFRLSPCSISRCWNIKRRGTRHWGLKGTVEQHRWYQPHAHPLHLRDTAFVIMPKSSSSQPLLHRKTLVIAIGVEFMPCMPTGIFAAVKPSLMISHGNLPVACDRHVCSEHVHEQHMQHSAGLGNWCSRLEMHL